MLTIKIHDLDWEIVFTEEELEETTCGETDKTSLVISLNTNIPEQLLKRTITHELCHAFIWSYGLENSFPLSEEQVCNFIETYIAEIDKLSKYIYNYYRKEIKEDD